MEKGILIWKAELQKDRAIEFFLYCVIPQMTAVVWAGSKLGIQNSFLMWFAAVAHTWVIFCCSLTILAET